MSELEQIIDPKEQFKKKLSDKEAFDMMLQLPQEMKNNPTILGIRKVYVNLSGRQAHKIWEKANERLEKIGA
jgi:ribosomal protein L5